MADIAFLTERMRLGFGVDLVVDQVAAGLVERGHGVTVYASYEDGTYGHRPYRLERLGVPAMRYAPLYDLEARRRARIAGLASKPHDVFFVETQPFFSLIPQLGGRAVAVDHGVVDTRGFPLWIRANFAYVEAVQQRWFFRGARRIVTVSEWLRGQLPASLRPRTVAIHNGADHYVLASDEQAHALRRKLGVGDGEVMLLYLGRLNPSQQPYKGTAELLATFATLHGDLPRARLVMAGFGTDEDAAWVRGGGAIPFVNVPVDDMPALLGAADLFVTASRWEGFNLNVVEAQRAGAPAVAFRAGAHAEVVDDGNTGVLVESSRGFADAIRELVRDDGRRQAMSARAREWAAGFRWSDAVARYDQLIDETLNGRGVA
ncbi:MAG: glycosyltransferase family 4 protein [Actinobacteria bacterium]|nr:MAG: glycosyltransferase family 4 protein [Actinomycetota bacterium]